MDAVWRLLWALPLVVAVGVVVMLLLRRVLSASAALRAQSQRVALRESLRLSNDTQVHVIEIEGRTWLVSESSARVSMQPTQQLRGTAAR